MLELGEDLKIAEKDVTERHVNEKKTTSGSLEDFVRGIIDNQPLPIDSIVDHCEKMGYGRSEVLELMLRMELEGTVRQLPGRIYAWNSIS